MGFKITAALALIAASELLVDMSSTSSSSRSYGLVILVAIMVNRLVSRSAFMAYQQLYVI